MKPLIIEQTKCSPKVVFDPVNNVFEIRGNVMLEDNKIFFHTIYQWWRAFQPKASKNIHLICDLEYFTTSTDMFLMDLFSILKEIPDTKVTWYYVSDDWDMKEYGDVYNNEYTFVNLKEKQLT